MKEKVKCKKCGLLIDNDLETCPYCGYPLKEENDNKENIINSNENATINDTKVETKPVVDHNPFHFESREYKLNYSKMVSLFLVGFIGLQAVSFIIQLILKNTNIYFLSTERGSGIINFSIYLMLFGTFLLIINKDILPLINEFKTKKTWLIGVTYGIMLIVISQAVAYTFRLIGIAFNVNQTSNSNETGIDSIVNLFPFASILIFGIIGPFCEELTYRCGLFSLVKKKNRVLAYALVCLIFGLIHFDFNFGSANYNLANELLNIPSYITAGMLLSYFYEKEGLGASTIAHCVNNLVSIILSIIITML